MDGTRHTAIIRPEVQVILEEGRDNWSAYVPSVPVTIATGKTRADVLRNIEAALVELLRFHHEEAMAEEAAEEAAEAASVASQS
jgi:predicted RNase H-like HicB family nuclease